MKIQNRNGNINLSQNRGVIGDGNIICLAQDYQLPEVRRIKTTVLKGVTQRRLEAVGWAGVLGSVFYAGMNLFNLFGSAASIESTYGIIWVIPACGILLTIGCIGVFLRRNKFVQIPMFTIEKGKSGAIYVSEFSAKCPICGGVMHQLKLAAKDFKTYFECENNARDHRGAIDLSAAISDIETDEPQ